jgi:hypothetical protein
MSGFKKIAALVLAIAPLVAGAQAPQQANPAPQAGAQPPATTSGSTAAQAPQAQSSASSPRYVTSENFYRPGAKPQPAVSAPSTAKPSPATPAALPAVAIKPNDMLATPRPAAPPSVPIRAAVPAIQVPQHASVQPPTVANPGAASRAVPAAVDYASGQLSVVADNAPLLLILNMIAAKTGAVVDVAPELQSEPVIARLGPGPVREVLTALLDSPRIDYIVLGGDDEGARLQRIMVRTRHAFGPTAVAAMRPIQPKPEDANEEEQLDQNGHVISNGTGTANSQLSQQQRRANWERTREAMRLAEIKQQAQERENEQSNPSFPDPPSQPQGNQPGDPPQNPPQDNPPQR